MIKKIIDKIKSLFKKEDVKPEASAIVVDVKKEEETKESLFNEWELGSLETPKKKRPYKRRKKASDKPKEETEAKINKVEEEVKKPKKKYYKKRKPKADKGE
jgi:hypothetical protein